MRATIQLCTYNRAHLLGRVLDACFEQTVASDEYEVVLVNDGSRDETHEIVSRAQTHAPVAFTAIHQANAGLARARNAGIARARGERIIFIDDDVIATPQLVAEHLRSHERFPDRIVRGAAINTGDLDRLPAPFWTLFDYSGNFFWTTNVSAPLATIRKLNGFVETFREYGWEDIELGLRMRNLGVRATFNPRALVFHYKPAPRVGDVEAMLRQARAQARTAVQLRALHGSWRVVLATGDDPLQRGLHRLARALRLSGRAALDFSRDDPDRPLEPGELRRARALAREAYFEELERAHAVSRERPAA